MNIVLNAIDYANKKHHGQVRKVSKEPYITHPLAVSYLLASYKSHSKHLDELLAVCILHDVLEDTDATFTELVTLFGPLVASIVFELTSDTEEIKRIGKNEYLMLKTKGMSSYALTIKLIDRLTNVRDNPKEQYKLDTIVLIDHLKTNRKLSKTQIKVTNDIIDTINSMDDVVRGIPSLDLCKNGLLGL